jgi:hypothetical protein
MIEPNHSTAHIKNDRFNVELSADKYGPPWPIRVRKWLKEAGRLHGLVCEGVTAIADTPTGHLAATNVPGRWRRLSRAPKRPTSTRPKQENP